MTHLAIIPARGGSIRIPRKNILSFLGKPIIPYSIEVALKIELVDELLVPTYGRKIEETTKVFGANLPFLRDQRSGASHEPLGYGHSFNQQFPTGVLIPNLRNRS